MGLKTFLSCISGLFVVFGSSKLFAVQVADMELSYVSNPLIWADVPDPDVIRVGEDFYMVSTTMHLMPGCPVMHSKDLVNWETIGYVFERLEDTPRYDLREGTVYGKGQWATSLRYRDGVFYVLFSPNDFPYRSYIYIRRLTRPGRGRLSRVPIISMTRRYSLMMTAVHLFSTTAEKSGCVN